ncbi:hypothetical protein RvY_13772 [Ramazzottius varieornatus]|uniref:Uncharacterized protein n=1 Tax=Ramazzottius varieornatus TaxID=947166 RepID=A0A1D1VP14_RAMVA|nr:hypothetical protein RvY_13772 [Ramazzottius varieornatus]
MDQLGLAPLNSNQIHCKLAFALRVALGCRSTKTSKGSSADAKVHLQSSITDTIQAMRADGPSCP